MTEPTGGQPPVSDDKLDDVLSALADKHRRHVLHYFLDTSDDVASVERLAAHVAATDEIDDRERVLNVLHHVALPKLEAAGLVEYDGRSATFQYRGHTLVTQFFRFITMLEAGEQTDNNEPVDTQYDGRASIDILLVENNPGDIRLIQEAFQDEGICNDIHVVTDGTEALDFCYQRGNHADAPHPDVILLNFDLPQTNGDEVLDQLRDNVNLRRIPVVVLTGSDAQKDILKSYDLGANAYLKKPVDTNEFIEIVQSVEEFWCSIVRLPDVQN